MSVKVDESGRRSVQVEVEVVGTPEQVWEAIATGPGVSSWFVPTEIDGREGGQVVCHFGPGMDSAATICAWDPPRRFAAEGPGMSPGMPPMATEWSVEARSGGTCVVRVVHSLFADTDDWDNQLESTEAGWPTFFRILAIYLEHFPGQAGHSASILAMPVGELSTAWETLSRSLGLESASPGARFVASGAGAPALAGVVEALPEIPNGHCVFLRLDEPSPGAGVIGVYDCGGASMASINLYAFGDDSAEVVAREEPKWQAWLAERFPAPDAANAVP